MSAFAEQSLADDPNAELARNSGYHVTVEPLHADHIRDIRAILLFLQGGALTLLLIGLVNLFNLID